MTYGISKGVRCAFRVKGRAAWMNPWDGKAYLIPDAEQTADGVSFAMPVESSEFQVFFFGDMETDRIGYGPHFLTKDAFVSEIDRNRLLFLLCSRTFPC